MPEPANKAEVHIDINPASFTIIMSALIKVLPKRRAANTVGKTVEAIFMFGRFDYTHRVAWKGVV